MIPLQFSPELIRTNLVGSARRSAPIPANSGKFIPLNRVIKA